MAWYNRGFVHGLRGEFDAALADFDQALQLKPTLADAWYNRGDIQRARGNYDAAIGDYTAALRCRPNFALAYFHRGECHYQLHRHEDAIADFSELIKLKPKLPAAYNNRGLAHAARNEHALAIADFTEVIRLDPHYAYAYQSRGLAYAATKDTERAMVDQIEAIRLEPKVATAYNHFARLWATCDDQDLRNAKLAVDLATRACELSAWEDWTCVATLSAACAEAGDRAAATHWAVKSPQLARKRRKKPVGPRCRPDLTWKVRPGRRPGDARTSGRRKSGPAPQARAGRESPVRRTPCRCRGCVRRAARTPAPHGPP